LKYSNGKTVGNINMIQVQTKQQLTKHMGPLRPYRPPPAWKSTSMGFILNPTTTRALFMNFFLPEFYNAKYKYCNDSKHYVKQLGPEDRSTSQSSKLMVQRNKQTQ